ncbi:alpha-2-macroglobulin [Aquimarina sp. U1-2]|uniref:alpha-2-macroglobulin family protein n=1 Tax=Aquimarina sp. U1-2 TaxID=2823141 RepID=UPI001AEC7BDF|nr:alpha-2-macroglobulin family protein [Aquimarina sp. U1-2]MBP2830969.1 alpha-2-macroglobulin [Aquimarina sp. U1-2]
MKKYIILMIICITNLNVVNGQNEYAPDWKKVTSFEEQGLPKSALEVVDNIYNKAKKENNDNQVIKAMLHKAKYVLTLEENAQLTIVNDFKDEIKQSTFPKRNVLESILANLYWQYFQQNRWKFYNRTQTSEKTDPEDFRTWDLDTLFAEIHQYFQKSITNEILAQQTDLKKFDDILIHTDNDSKRYRPTLYDFLAHNALQFYKTSETSITKPAYAFTLNDPNFIEDHVIFSALEIAPKDSLSLQGNALKLYQNLIQFHRRDKELEALVEVNIDRLRFVSNHAVFENKEAKLLKTLTSEKQKIDDKSASALYNFEIATVYKEQASTFIPNKNEKHQWKLKEAIALCDETIKRFPDSRGAEKCQSLKAQILHPELTIKTENYLPIQQPARLLITYKNLNKLYIKALRVNQKQLQSLKKLYQITDKIEFFNSLKVHKNWESEIKNEKDFQTHTTEVLLPQLEQGQYLILATVNKDISQNDLFSYGDVQVSNLALVENRTPQQSIFQVIDRNTGAPVANAKLHLKTNSEQGYRNQLDKTLLTDPKGQAYLKLNNYYNNVTITATYKNDSAYFKGYYLNQSYTPRNDATTNQQSTFLFTDRSIYRPGQIVYFKGIMMMSSGKENSKVLANQSTYVTLKDVNGQDVQTLTFTTNEYGSFAGEFILPSAGITGRYTLQTNNYQSISITVEEYKRPKFETTFDPVTETFKVNDVITLSATANSYAGSAITNAKVTYRVHRKVQYPRWYYWYPRYTSEPQEITHGETTTNDKGAYIIKFKALPDPDVDKKNLPIFTYEITADVTDINGETRSTTTVVNVGYHTMTVTLSVKNQMDKAQKDHHLIINTKNLNNENIAASGDLKIYKLKAPNKPLRQRPWKAPDYPGFSEEEFRQLFPNDAYDNESDFRNWEKGVVVFDTTFNTEATKEKGTQKIALGALKKWESGKYVIEVKTKDRFGQEVKDIQYISVFGQDDKTVSDQQLFEITTNKSSYSAGEEAIVKLSSASENITITVDIEKNHKIINTQLIRLSTNSKTIKIPVEAKDVGGFTVSYSFANYNDYQNGTVQIAVPYKPTTLSIETETFRDKLNPGQQETWSFTIKGPKGDQIAAELLASMYDMSLDQFMPHQWTFNPLYRPIYHSQYSRQASRSFGVEEFQLYNHNHSGSYSGDPVYDQFNWFGLYFGQQYYATRSKVMNRSAAPMLAMEAIEEESDSLDEIVVTEQGAEANTRDAENNNLLSREEEKEVSLDGIKIRKNLQETAFFIPQLTTDASGNVSFSFTAPEALTRWKLQLLAHTPTLHAATTALETVTQKELMVLPNPPRFLREGDKIILSSKISNLADKNLSGSIELQLINAVTNEPIDTELHNNNARQDFEVSAKGNTNVSWELHIPDNIQTVHYKIIAKAGDFSDGEQSVLPVLSNRMLVTETLPMWIRSNETKTFTLNKLKNNTSSTLKHHKLTLEMTSNPAWYAVQALPYLMEYPYECSEQTFSRFYANALASHIATSNPRIQEVFNQWKSTDALLSNLEKNPELKAMIIQETPWLRDALSETEQKKRIALLFDLNKMNNELQAAITKLQNLQYGSGGFPWFKGGHENRFITQHIATGFGHLKKLGVTDYDTKAYALLQNAIRYLDQEFIEEYETLKRYCKKNAIDLNKNHLSYTQVHYLYMRSFFSDIKRPKKTNEAWEYYLGQSRKYWLKQNLYAQGMIALILHRNKNTSTAATITASLDERSITSNELGMYWKSNVASWYWYQAPIETQSLMIEVFSEIESVPKRTEIVDKLKIWLLKNKQTNRWQTTKATANAVYALLLEGSDWLSITDKVDIVLGDQPVDPAKIEDIQVEAGTGYFKTSWTNKEIAPKMATAKITKKGKGIAWGALYWQYFENLDKITTAKTPLELNKKLFLRTYTDTGEEITEITTKTNLQLGDLIRVRIELRSDRDMEFIHLKDMRASGLEPVTVISQYKWQDGLGYYQSTKDAATHFFFDYLPKGIYVFEYDLRVNNKGNFSNGITTIQSMYAPEFSSHSKGVRIEIK